MEATGSYWKPIYNLLEMEEMPALVVNAQHIKAVPGRKTDVKDAEWIADLLRHGLLNGSFIPDRGQRELKEIIRYRRSMVQERARELNRIQTVLEGANVKLSSVVSEINGKSSIFSCNGRDVLDLLQEVEGGGGIEERDNPIEKMVRQNQIDINIFELIMISAAVPFYTTFAINITPHLDLKGWGGGNCPVCGRLPAISLISEENKRMRLMQCCLCHTQWWVPAGKCPFCGSGAEDISYFVLGDQRRKVFYCRNCRRYIKTVYLRGNELFWSWRTSIPFLDGEARIGICSEEESSSA